MHKFKKRVVCFGNNKRENKDRRMRERETEITKEGEIERRRMEERYGQRGNDECRD